MKDKIIYQLTIEDIQNVAEENFGRKLTSKEINKILYPIADRIPWYDAIYDAIKEKLKIEELETIEKNF
jgi:hypothetical protein